MNRVFQLTAALLSAVIQLCWVIPQLHVCWFDGTIVHATSSPYNCGNTWNYTVPVSTNANTFPATKQPSVWTHCFSRHIKGKVMRYGYFLVIVELLLLVVMIHPKIYELLLFSKYFLNCQHVRFYMTCWQLVHHYLLTN